MKKVFVIFSIVLILFIFTVPCFAYIGSVSNETDLTFSISVDGSTYFDLLPSTSYTQDISSVYNLYVKVPDYVDSILFYVSSLGTYFDFINCSYEETSTSRVYRLFDFTDSYFIFRQANSSPRTISFISYTYVFYKPYLDFHSQTFSHMFDFVPNLFGDWQNLTILFCGVISVCIFIFLTVFMFKKFVR